MYLYGYRSVDRWDSSHERHWEISNLRTCGTYSLIPGPKDGASDAFGVGDLWVLRYHPNELNDGVAITVGSADATRANIDKFLNGEPKVDKDVVIWYGAHFEHDQNHEEARAILWARLSALSGGSRGPGHLFQEVE